MTMSSKSKDDSTSTPPSSYSSKVVDLSSTTYEIIKNNIASLPEQLQNTASSLTSSSQSALSSWMNYNAIQNYVSSYLWTTHYGYNGNDNDYCKKLYPLLYSNTNNTLTDNVNVTTFRDRRNSWNWFMENPLSGYRSGDLNVKTTSQKSIRSIMCSLELSSDVATDGGITSSHSNISESAHSEASEKQNDVFSSVSDAEKASRLAEGSLLILRDMILDDAIELHEALRYWNDRWERPLLSWFEAGPLQWMSPEGYNHQNVGNKVSQIQAVLARRCESVGELQQQLLRASWNYGVAQWGVLGQGKQWAAVAGGNENTDLNNSFRVFNNMQFSFNSTSTNGDSPIKQHIRLSNVVTNKNNQAFIDSEKASWSIDAILIIRNFLSKVGNYPAKLPFVENWPHEMENFSPSDDDSTMIISNVNEDQTNDCNRYLPIWASKQIIPDDGKNYNKQYIISIIDLNLMAAEVSALLSIMEDQLQVQRNQELMKLKPPSRLRSKWMVWIPSLPIVGYCAWEFCRGNRGVDLIKHVLFKVSTFWLEHVSEPIKYICAELFTGKGRTDITDLKARLNAMKSLQAMINHWLEKSYPKLPIEEREKIANAMDISLIEKRKEDSLKNPLFEIQDIVHMSLIEMQFIKKELLNAMSAIDDLMESNEMNFRLAAMAPTFLLVYFMHNCFHFLSYGILKLGKSKDEIYASLRNIILDIERLLVMRDDPPPNNSTSINISSQAKSNKDNADDMQHDTSLTTASKSSHQVLGSYDLGMLMLLVHECRSMLWKHRKRFTRTTLKNVTEDLAELAGERGCLTVKQQLQIISRMCRTYSFLKVVSSGVRFVDVSRYV